MPRQYADPRAASGPTCRLPAAQWGETGLLLPAVAKVCLFDFSFVPLGYRVPSFMVPALVLRGGSYLDQRQGSLRLMRNQGAGSSEGMPL